MEFNNKNLEIDHLNTTKSQFFHEETHLNVENKIISDPATNIEDIVKEEKIFSKIEIVDDCLKIEHNQLEDILNVFKENNMYLKEESGNQVGVNGKKSKKHIKNVSRKIRKPLQKNTLDNYLQPRLQLQTDIFEISKNVHKKEDSQEALLNGKCGKLLNIHKKQSVFQKKSFNLEISIAPLNLNKSTMKNFMIGMVEPVEKSSEASVNSLGIKSCSNNIATPIATINKVQNEKISGKSIITKKLVIELKKLAVFEENGEYFIQNSRHKLFKGVNKELKTQANERSNFKCDVCGKMLKTKKSLSRHKMLHQDNISFPCSTCNSVMSSKYSLQSHVYRYHVPDDEKVTVRCGKCSYKTTFKGDLRKHMNMVHLKKRKIRKCEKCDYTGTNSGLFYHMETCHSDKEYSCELCNYSGKSKYNYAQHLKLHRQENSCFCSKCPFKTNSKRNLSIHFKTHDDIYQKCPKCIKILKSTFFKAHMRKHVMTRKKKKCPVCQIEVFDLTRHIKLHAKRSEKQSCSECSYTCKTKYNMRQHMIKLHQSLKETSAFICFHCSKQFANKYTLTDHIQNVHGENNTVNCPVCDKKVKAKRYLWSHMKLHKTEDEVEIFVCDLCPQFKTRYRSVFKCHEISHKRREEASIF